jgi:hypothetical protein
MACGLHANCLDPLVGERPQGRCGIATPVVDNQRGYGVRPTNRAASRQRLQGYLRLALAPRQTLDLQSLCSSMMCS